jgi:hypothetical protein
MNVEALLIEREGYLRRGLKDRVAQVDEILKRDFNVAVETATAEPETERAAKPRVAKRKAE